MIMGILKVANDTKRSKAGAGNHLIGGRLCLTKRYYFYSPA